MRSSRPTGISAARDLPPAHDQGLVHRQLAPHVTDGQQVVEPRVGHHHHVGLRGRVQRGEEPAGARGEDVGHPLGTVGHVVQAELVQPRDRAIAARGGEVAALGEDHEGVVGVQPGGEGGDLRLEVLPGPRVGGDEAGRDPAQDHVDGRVPREGVLEDDARLAAVPVQQRVHQGERVARPRVAAADENRPLGVPVGCRPVGADPQCQHPARLAEEADQRELHEVVVDAGEVRRPDLPPEARRQPQAEEHEQQQRLGCQVEERHPEAAAAPASGPGSPARAPPPR